MKYDGIHPLVDRAFRVAMPIVLFVAFAYLMLVVGPQFVGLLHQDGVL